jgi:hypothetical protein
MACCSHVYTAPAAVPADRPAWPRMFGFLTTIGVLFDIWAEAADMRRAAYRRHRLNGD